MSSLSFQLSCCTDVVALVNTITRAAPRVLFVCGREPDYIRNRLLLHGLSQLYPVSVIASARPRYGERLASILPRLVHAAARTDLVVAGFLGQPIAILAALLLRKPVLLDAFVSVYDTLCLDRRTVPARSPLGQLAFVLDQKAMSRASLTLVDTECQRRFFSETFGLPRDHYHVHYLGPDPRLHRVRRELDTNSVTVVHYSSYLPLHGVEVITKAANLLRDEARIRFRLIGTGPRRQRAQSLARQLDVPNITFIDWLSADDLSYQIAQASIGLGGHFADNPKARRVIAGKTFQFLACGVPTIVGDCPANREIFTPGRDVVAVPMDDPTALAEAIRSLALNPRRCRELGAAGAELIRGYFTPARITANLRLAVDLALDRTRT